MVILLIIERSFIGMKMIRFYCEYEYFEVYMGYVREFW